MFAEKLLTKICFPSLFINITCVRGACVYERERRIQDETVQRGMKDDNYCTRASENQNKVREREGERMNEYDKSTLVYSFTRQT